VCMCVFAVLKFELRVRASHLLDRRFTAWAMLPALSTDFKQVVQFFFLVGGHVVGGVGTGNQTSNPGPCTC
jgi:hypothetical protein